MVEAFLCQQQCLTVVCCDAFLQWRWMVASFASINFVRQPSPGLLINTIPHRCLAHCCGTLPCNLNWEGNPEFVHKRDVPVVVPVGFF